MNIKVSIIVAVADNNVIGKNNELLWHLPNDMKFFKQTTWAMPVIMGRKTFESLNNKPLNGRLNIVITSQKNINIPNVYIASSINEALQIAHQNLYKEAFIIGGGEVYKQTIAMANTIYITRVHYSFDGDTYFPEIDKTQFKLTHSTTHLPNPKHLYSYTFETWEKQ